MLFYEYMLYIRYKKQLGATVILENQNINSQTSFS